MAENKYETVSNGIFYTLALFAAYCLKSHYSRAGSDDLLWILAPVAGLIECFSGIHFIYEANSGYISQAQGIIIAPACAGINFLIIAFGMSVFTGIRHMSTTAQRFVWLALCAVSAYALTIGVNSLRILISIFIYNSFSYGEWLTSERCHRIEGVVIYFFFQCIFYFIIRRIATGHAKRKYPKYQWGGKDSITKKSIAPLICSGLVPLGWYLGITVFFPFLNAAHRHNLRLFGEHCGVVAITSMIIFGIIMLVRVEWNKRFNHYGLKVH